MRKFLMLSFLLFPSATFMFAQSDSIWSARPALTFTMFVDVFYGYDFNQPKAIKRLPFLCNHNRHHAVSVNHGFIHFGIAHVKYRARIALQAGTYVNDNYAAEPGVLKNLFEANGGIALGKRNNVWLEGGIFASHIGFESAVSIDNWTLTRSLVAENSPYYLAGAKLTYRKNEKWMVAALVCNGWQRIQRVSGSTLPAVGTQLSFHPSETATFNWSTFVGTDDPDSTRRMRYYHNFYGIFRLSQQVGLIAGFDIGTQQKSKGSSAYDVWFSPVFMLRYAWNSKWSATWRGEYYQDYAGVIISDYRFGRFGVAGISLNIDYMPVSFIACRMEGRWLGSVEPLFPKGNAVDHNNFFLIAAVAIKFDKTWAGK